MPTWARTSLWFAKLAQLQKTRGIVYSDNRLRLDAPMTWGELAMLLAPRGESIQRRIQRIRETGHRPARQLGGDGLVRRAGYSEIRHGPGRGRDQPARRVLRFRTTYTRRAVYEAFRG